MSVDKQETNKKKLFRIKRHWYSEHFASYLESNARYNFLFGGRGSSKSHSVFLKHFAETFQSRYTNIYYCRHDETTIRETTFRDMSNFLEFTGLNVYFEYSKAQNSSMVFKNKITGYTLTPFGLRDIDKIKGIAQPTHIFIDEMDKCTQEAFGAVNAVLRTPKAKGYLQFTGMWNPTHDKSWIRTMFFDENNAYELKEEIVFGDEVVKLREQSYLNNSTMYDNEYIDHEAYKQTLIINANGKRERLECDLFGRWGKTEVKNPAILNFNKSIHVQDIKRNERHALIFSFDFNCDPLICLVLQIYRENNEHFIHVLNEIKLKDSRTPQMIEFLQKNYSTQELSRALYTGDATGKNPHSSSTLSNWQQLSTKLKISPHRLKLPSVNPNVLTSLEDLDYLLYAHPNFRIHPRCEQLIFELQYTEKDDKGIIKSNRKDDTQKADLLDGLRYPINVFCVIENNCRDNPRYFGIK